MKRILYIWCLLFLVFSSCNDEDEITVLADVDPVIAFDNETGVYSVKSGRELVISPTYQFVENALYVWSRDGKVIGEDSALVFCEERLGEVFIQLQVSTPFGSTEEELKVDVVALEVPTVSLPGSDKGYVILTGNELKLAPSVAATSIPTAFSWSVDGKEVGTEKDYTFKKDEKGEFALKFVSRNEDGADSLQFKVKVSTPEDMPFKWNFEQEEFFLSSGRTVRLMPLDIVNAFDAEYTWTLDGREVQTSDKPEYLFNETREGSYTVKVSMKNSHFQVDKQLKVTVCPPEGTYRREKTASSQADWNKVYTFMPAPGQFVNKNYTADNMEQACAYAAGQMQKGGYVSLGGFGGYIVVGFDHSIANTGDYDLAIVGNSFEGSSEPGVVWVMQDENGDGLPNDTWYELKGSETGKAGTVQDYAVTYYRPKGPRMEVQWTDSKGNRGSVDYLAQYHDQGYYYPAWVKADSYTLRGTCLKAMNYDQSQNGSYWVNPTYDWGYVDNFSPIDRLSGDDNAGAAANSNHFKISNAVGPDGKPVNLKYIDFVKVQTAVNTKSGWLGELSTEVFGFYDYSMKKK